MVFLTPAGWLWNTCAEVRCLGAQGFPQDFYREKLRPDCRMATYGGNRQWGFEHESYWMFVQCFQVLTLLAYVCLPSGV